MYNEAERFQVGLIPILKYLEVKFPRSEVLLVDDGSHDDTSTKLKELINGFPNLAVKAISFAVNRGKGAAVREGMRKATGTYRLFADADNATPIEEIERLLPMVKTSESIVIGSRGLDSTKLEVRQPWWRERAGRIFNALLRFIVGLPFHDTQCGFKLFGAKAAEICFRKQRLDGFAFDVELLWIARSHHFPVTEVPVRWRHVPQSRVQLLTHGFRMAIDALRIRFFRE